MYGRRVNQNHKARSLANLSIDFVLNLKLAVYNFIITKRKTEVNHDKKSRSLVLIFLT